MNDDKVRINTIINENSVEIINPENKIIVTDKKQDTSVNVIQKETSVVTVISKQPKGIGLSNPQTKIIVTDKKQDTFLITEKERDVVTIASKGPKGDKGDKGDIGTVILSSSFGGGVIITGSLLVSGSFGENVTITQNLIVSGTITSPGSDREIIFNSGSVLGTDPNFVFSSLGRLGIGTYLPISKLSVNGGNINIGTGYGIGGNNVGSYSGFITYHNDGLGFLQSASFGFRGSAYIDSIAYPDFLGFATNDLAFFTSTNGISKPSEVMRIVGSTGRVGIGTSTPTNTLQVAGGVTAISFTGSLFGTASYSLTAENIDGGFF